MRGWLSWQHQKSYLPSYEGDVSNVEESQHQPDLTLHVEPQQFANTDAAPVRRSFDEMQAYGAMEVNTQVGALTTRREIGGALWSFAKNLFGEG